MRVDLCTVVHCHNVTEWYLAPLSEHVRFICEMIRFFDCMLIRHLASARLFLALRHFPQLGTMVGGLVDNTDLYGDRICPLTLACFP